MGIIEHDQILQFQSFLEIVLYSFTFLI